MFQEFKIKKGEVFFDKPITNLHTKMCFQYYAYQCRYNLGRQTNRQTSALLLCGITFITYLPGRKNSSKWGILKDKDLFKGEQIRILYECTRLVKSKNGTFGFPERVPVS